MSLRDKGFDNGFAHTVMSPRFMLSGQVIELRVDYGPGYRVYFGRDGNKLVILLIGRDKRTQAKDIAAAKDYWADYKTRKTEKQDDTHS